MTGIDIREWIDRRECPVPPPLLSHLTADASVSADALVEAAERELRTCAAGSSRDHDAAFSLLAADAYITYACLWLVLNDGGAQALSALAARVAAPGWRE